MQVDEQVQRWWDEHCARTGTPRDRLTAVESFGDSPALADELLALVLEGRKRASASLVSDFEGGTPLPRPGDHWVVLDGSGRPAAVLRTTEVRTGPLTSVDDAFAFDEGEDDRTRERWAQEHRRYFTRQAARTGVPFDERTTPVVFERFALAWPPPGRAPQDDPG